jgi:hypothetical protein
MWIVFSLVQAEIWHITPTNGMRDVAITPNGLVRLAGKDGIIGSSPVDGVTFIQDEEARGIESIVAGRSGAWAVGINGALWRKLFSSQF